MGQDTDVPQSVRIRTGDGNESRFRAIERAAEYYDCNRSDAVGYACNDVVELSRALRTILDRDDLTGEQRREIAETFDRATRGLSVETEVSVDVTADR